MMSRILENIGVLTCLSFWFFGIIGPTAWIYVLLYAKYWYVAFVYAAWVYYDRNTPKQGGRRVEFVRNLPIWRWACNYFPAKIVKTTELDPSKNYLLGYHPHGMYSTGLHANFGLEGNNVSQKFPGIKSHFLTLDANFCFPLFREVCLAVGGCSVSRESLNYLLSKSSGGNAVFIVPGGAREALYCQPGTEILYLKKRKGFIKVAIENGSPLVPIYSFGESDIFSQPQNPKGSLLRRIQDKVIDLFGMCPIIVWGNGMLPRRYPITSVVGAPIPVQKIQNPPQEYIDKIHEEYMAALLDLFYKYRDIYGHPGLELIIH